MTFISPSEKEKKSHTCASKLNRRQARWARSYLCRLWSLAGLVEHKHKHKNKTKCRMYMCIEIENRKSNASKWQARYARWSSLGWYRYIYLQGTKPYISVKTGNLYMPINAQAGRCQRVRHKHERRSRRSNTADKTRISSHTTRAQSSILGNENWGLSSERCNTSY